MALGLLDGGKLLDGLGDDVEALLELRLGDDERRSEADDVAMGRLGLLYLSVTWWVRKEVQGKEVTYQHFFKS